MIHTLREGMDLHDETEGAAIQSVKIKDTREEATLKGMVDDRTEFIGVWSHSSKKEFSVEGSGDYTVTLGVVEAGEEDLALAGGKVFISDDEITQTLGAASKWSYNGKHYPHATLGA